MKRSREDALIEAQDLAFDAMEADDPAERMRLAQQSVNICEDCADAWRLLAEAEDEGSQSELDLLLRAVKAGEAALGRQAFVEDVGLFWGLMETRPYMRARLSLAQALWSRGEKMEAVAHQQDLLRLNPDDNQGIRYQLASWLAELGDDPALADLLKRYRKDDAPFMTWPAALAAFRRGGDGPKSRKALATAMASNRHVTTFLLDRRRLAKYAPAFYEPGTTSEADLYVHDFGAGWNATPGALDWLRARRDAQR